MLNFAIVSISILVNLLPAFLVIFSNPKSVTHRYFFILIIAFVGFGLINYISLSPVLFGQIVWVRLDLFVAVYLFLFLYLTFLAFPNKHAPHLTGFDRLIIVFSVLVSCLTLSPWVFSGLKTTSLGVQPLAAPGIAFFVLQQLTMLTLTTRLCLRKFRKSKDLERRQLRAVISGAAFAVLSIIFFNLVAVQAFHTDSLIPYSSLGVIAFTFSFSFALVRYRFLDFRILVARSLAYFLLLSTMVGVYVLLVFGVVRQFFGSHSTFSQQVLPILAAILLAFTEPFLKRFFDRVTNRLFYRDAYDPQMVLKELNGLTTSTVNLDKLINDSVSLLGRTVKCSFCAFVLVEANGHHRAFSSHRAPDALSELSKDIEKILQPHQPVVAEYLEDQEQLKLRMAHLQVELVVPMYANRAFIGFIMFGSKQNGILYSRQDVQLLALVADSLSVATQNALRFQEIENFNLTLQQKVHEATHKLRKANDKLKALDESKDDFISMASHQLRTPLTTIKGYTSMVLDGDAGKITAQQSKLLGQALFSSQRMVYLIADLLNVSRLRTGKFVIDATTVNLAEVVGQELAQLRETAAAHSLTLEYEQPAAFPELLLDETKTRQVIMNFIDNAIYYTPAGGRIEVQLIDKPTVVELRVKDNGIGVPRSEQPHLFTKFYRAGNARLARPDGTGLGLFMAKKVIIAQGGALIFESHEGKGSTFGFTLSKAKLAASK
jgi:signal transduction histidine kinase